MENDNLESRLTFMVYRENNPCKQYNFMNIKELLKWQSRKNYRGEKGLLIAYVDNTIAFRKSFQFGNLTIEL